MSIKASVHFQQTRGELPDFPPPREFSPFPAITGSRGWGLPSTDGIAIAKALIWAESTWGGSDAALRLAGMFTAVFEFMGSGGFASPGRSVIMDPQEAADEGADWIYVVYLVGQEAGSQRLVLEVFGSLPVEEDWVAPESWNLNVEAYGYSGRDFWWWGSPEEAVELFTAMAPILQP